MTPGEAIPKLVLPDDRPPLFVGAGVIKSAEMIALYADIPEVAVQIIGDYSYNRHDGSDPTFTKQVFYYDAQARPAAAYNAIGLQNCGREAARSFLSESIKRVRAAGQLAIVGVTALKHEDPEEIVPELVEWGLGMGADGVEVNGACPNEESDELLCYDYDKTFSTMERVRRRVGAEPYVILKVPVLSEGLVNYYRRNHLPVDGIGAVNSPRVLSPSTSGGAHVIEVNEGYAGQSGPILRNPSRRNLEYWITDNGLMQPDVWSIGGVDNGYEARKRIDMGALAVGAAQAPYRSDNPKELFKRFAREYTEAAIDLASPLD